MEFYEQFPSQKSYADAVAELLDDGSKRVQDQIELVRDGYMFEASPVTCANEIKSRG